MDNKKNTDKKVVIELDELEKVTGGTGSDNTPVKKPSPISGDTQKNV
ncbi:MAG: hypothetical protein IJH94_03325 [Clostridia bacterium]|nr:hypothetical protein [Clostridia bacterium]